MRHFGRYPVLKNLGVSMQNIIFLQTIHFTNTPIPHFSFHRRKTKVKLVNISKRTGLYTVL